MAKLEIRGLEKKFDQTAVLRNIDLDVPDGELCVFVGPSGCGKSTLLRCIAGLEPISDGELRIGGRDISNLPPAQRGVAMVFQSYALYPHMSVAENISFGLRMHGLERSEIDRKVRGVAEVLGLQEFLQRKPRTLSGGQRQRVAIGRALVREPQLFLLDEPLSNLDAGLRVQMRVEIARLHREIGATMVYVTHDQVESMTLADRIVVLNEGRIEQIGTPLELYNNPRNLFVAGFIGSPRMNFIDVSVIDGDVDLVELALPGGGSVGLPFDGSALEPGATVTLGVRPEHLADHGIGAARLPAEVTAVEHLGGESHVYASLSTGGDVTLRAPGTSALKIGDHAWLGLQTESAHLFDRSGQALQRLPGVIH